mmetsp:Transcript_132275/g.313586  ORF Transcript_132275/g.313586 Transcript_132275/m.313586 type:complete len:351 (+) Transcript_132275:659-1711(+)
MLLAVKPLLRHRRRQPSPEKDPAQHSRELHREVSPPVPLLHLPRLLGEVFVQQPGAKKPAKDQVGGLGLEEVRTQVRQVPGGAVSFDEPFLVEELHREARVVGHLRVQLRGFALEEGQRKHRRQAPRDVLARPPQRAILLEGLHRLPLVQGAEEDGGGQRELAGQTGQVGGDEPLNLDEGLIQEDHLAQQVEAAPSSPATHLSVHEASKLQRVSTEDCRATRHVDSKRQGASGKDHPEVPSAEEDLHGILVRLLQTFVMHSDSSPESLDHPGFSSSFLSGIFDLILDILLPHSEGFRRVEGELRINLILNVLWLLRLRHHHVLGDVNRLRLGGAAAFVVLIVSGCFRLLL